MLFTAVLSATTSAGDCGWPIYVSSIFVDVDFYQISNYPPDTTSTDDVMEFLIILHYICTGTFYGGIACIGVLYFGCSKKCPPAQLRDSGSDM